MKKILALLLALSLFAVCFSGCNDPGNQADGTVTHKSYSSEELSGMRTADFSPVPYAERTRLSDEEIKSVIAKVPSDKYETYPGLTMDLTSATLYCDGEVTSVDLKDQRLVKLINLFMNTIYYRQCAWTQGLLNGTYLDDLEKESFKLVLDCQYGGDGIHPSTYDTIIVINEWFVLLDYDAQNYNGEDLPCAMGYEPLSRDYRWLDLFGF